jgi:hypothetical protein
MEEMIDYVTACETFLEKMEACTTQSELDKLCQVECILFAKSFKELNDRKIPIVKIDSSLEKYKNMALFQDKVDKANETLRQVGLSVGG